MLMQINKLGVGGRGSQEQGGVSVVLWDGALLIPTS
jgi:hypothetical protein